MFDLMLISFHQDEDNSCTNEKGAEVLIDAVPDEENEADQPSETDRYGRGFPTIIPKLPKG